MATYDRRTGFERRKEARNLYSGPIFFATRKELYEGKLKNYSPSGLFIKTKNFFLENENITVALPYSAEKDDKRRAVIIWCDGNGMGIRLQPS
jgi:hypothetical protein